MERDLLMFFSIRVILIGILNYLILGILISKKYELFKKFKIWGIITIAIGILILISSFFTEIVDGMLIIFLGCLFILVTFIFAIWYTIKILENKSKDFVNEQGESKNVEKKSIEKVIVNFSQKNTIQKLIIVFIVIFVFFILVDVVDSFLSFL